MNLAQIFREAEVPYVRGIIHDTWGHLAPKPDVVYTGFILFTHAVCGETLAIDWQFVGPGGDLDSSPWFAEDLAEHLYEMVERRKLRPGSVYLWRGRYTRTPDEECEDSALTKEGEGRFTGRLRRIKIRELRAK